MRKDCEKIVLTEILDVHHCPSRAQRMQSHYPCNGRIVLDASRLSKSCSQFQDRHRSGLQLSPQHSPATLGKGWKLKDAESTKRLGCPNSDDLQVLQSSSVPCLSQNVFGVPKTWSFWSVWWFWQSVDIFLGNVGDLVGDLLTKTAAKLHLLEFKNLVPDQARVVNGQQHLQRHRGHPRCQATQGFYSRYTVGNYTDYTWLYMIIQ